MTLNGACCFIVVVAAVFVFTSQAHHQMVAIVVNCQYLWPRMKMRVPHSNHSVKQILVDAAVAKVFKLPYPNWVSGPPMRGRYVLA